VIELEVHHRYSPHTAFSVGSLPHRIIEYALVARLPAALSAGNLDDAGGLSTMRSLSLFMRDIPHSGFRDDAIHEAAHSFDLENDFFSGLDPLIVGDLGAIQFEETAGADGT
jgi:hypothetical protein